MRYGFVRSAAALLLVVVPALGLARPTSAKSAAPNPLVDAARRGAAAEVEALLARGCDPNAPDEQSGKTPLVAAALDGHPEIARLLLQRGADPEARALGSATVMLGTALRRVNSAYSGRFPTCGTGLLAEARDVAERDRIGVTPLMAASFAGSTRVVETLIADRADLEARSFEGGTALMFAAAKDAADVVRVLVAAGADLEARGDDRQTATMLAAWDGGNPAALVALVGAGADLNARDRHGFTALMGASYANAGAVVAILLAPGADVDVPSEDGRTALHFAIEGNSATAVRALVDADASLDVRNVWGDTPLMISAGYDDAVEILRHLVASGADVHAIDRGGVRNVLLVAELNGNSEAACLLEAAGATLGLDARLLLAADRGESQLVVDLLDRGANISTRSGGGRTALSYSVDAGRTDTVRVLLDRHADPNVRDILGETPLMSAAFEGHGEIVRLLLAAGADPNARLRAEPGAGELYTGGTTALMRAAIRGNVAVARMLVGAGADLSLTNDDGETARSVAERFGETRFVRQDINRVGMTRVARDVNHGCRSHDGPWSASQGKRQR